MRALTIGADGDVAVEDVAEPAPRRAELLVEALALGVCGTDRWLVQRGTPRLPPDQDHLILGHESLGRVLEAPAGSGFGVGDLVVGTVRRPDPIPCPACGAGESDLCENDGYTERGIGGLDGFGSERYGLETAYAIKVDPALGLAGVLVEPTSIVAKGWEQLERMGRRPARRVLVLGAGPIGMLAALLGVQRGCEVHVVDQVAAGLKPAQSAALGASYHTSTSSLDGGFDAVLECSGALLVEALRLTAPGGVTCLISAGHTSSETAFGITDMARDLLRHNKMVVGTVNSNRRHFELAHHALAAADRAWLLGLLGPCVPLDDWRIALAAGQDQIKAVIQFATL